MEESECERVCIVSLHERDSPLSLSIAHTCSPTHTHAKSKPSNHSLICHTLTVSSRNQTVKERERETFTKKKDFDREVLWRWCEVGTIVFCIYKVLYILGCMSDGVCLCGCVRDACLHHNKFLHPVLLPLSDSFHLRDAKWRRVF